MRSFLEKKKLRHKLLKETARALCDFKMLQPGDRVLAAVSGGKDSMSMLRLFLDRREQTPFPFDLMAVHVKPAPKEGSEEMAERMSALFLKWKVPFEIVPAVFEMKDEEGGESRNCFWCSWNRRKVLFETAKRVGATKLALGHHRDDLIETALLNLFHQGKFASMLPEQSYFQGEFRMIRPLCYIEETDLRQFAEDEGFPAETCRCPLGDSGERARIERFLDAESGENPALRSNIFRAVLRSFGISGSDSAPGFRSIPGRP